MWYAAQGFFFVLGTVFGSFGNVLIHRLPEGKSIGGRSACPHCGKTVRFIDLLPVVSFLGLGARCRDCHRRISWQYPLVELGSGLLFLFALERTSPSLSLSIILALCLWLLLLLAVTDAKTGMMPDALNIPFVGLSLLYAALFWDIGTWPLPVFLILVCQGAVIAGGFMGFLWLVGRGRWVGSGDVILATGMGFLLTENPLHVILALAIAYMLGAVVAAVLLLTGRATRKSHIPFGPFLAVGAFAALAFGAQILAAIGY